MKIILVITESATQFHWGFVYPLLDTLRDCKIKYKYTHGKKRLDIFGKEGVSYIRVPPPRRSSLEYYQGFDINGYRSLIHLGVDEEKFLLSRMRRQ